MTPFWGRIYRGIGYSVATFIIIYATLVNVGFLLTPYLNDHKAEFETWGSQLLKTPISIGHVSVAWSRLEPEIELNNVTILNKETNKPTFAIRRVNIHLQVIRSLFTWQPQVESIKIAGVELTVHEFKAGQFHIEGLRDITITDDFTGASMKSDAILGWIFSVSQLALREIEIRYIPEHGTEKSITLDHLALSNDDKQHQLTGLALLNQEVPTKVDINLVWRGDFTDLSHITADISLYLEGISLSQFLKGKSWHELQIQEGLGSAKINLHWDSDQLQKVHTQFQIYELEIKSLASKKTQLFSRVSGNVDWSHEGDKQTLSGSEILIDFPDHLWPTTSFSVSYVPTTTNDYAVQTLDVGYMNLVDIVQLALDSGFVADEIKKNILAINPKGEIRGFHAKSNGDWSDLTAVPLSAEFSGLSTDEWKKLPGVANLLGSIAWDGKQGTLKLNSRQAKITLSSLFSKPLPFNQLSGYLTWNKDEKNNWILNAKNIFIVNPDARIQATATLNLPANASPLINLSSTFSVSNVANIPNYVPAKVMDPELVAWLKQALQAGTIDYAKVDMQGKFSDFASGSPAAKLQVSAILKNINLNYAPKWPALNNIEGKVKFTNQEMTIDATSANISGVPIKQIHATLDHFSDNDPTVLNLQAHIQSTLDQGQQFLQASPLNDLFGKDLQSMQMQGPMDLTLGLSMPVKKPESIKVQGSINTSGASLNLQEWNLALTQLQGKFQFSEQDIQAANVQARLFDQPITLSLSTQHTSGKATFVLADIKGSVNAEVIKAWLNLPSLTDYVRGSTNYKAEVHLASHDKNQANEIILTSDLKGVSVTLPQNYGKKAEDALNFRLDILSAQNQPLKIKMDYGKLLSAAVALKNQHQKWQLQSGELRLGPGANWQTKPGMLISGHVDTLDWEKLQKEFSTQKTTASVSPIELFSANNASGITIREVNLNIDTLRIFDHEFKKINVSIEKSNTAWELGLNSELIRGDVTVPFDMDQEAVTCRFDRLHLESSNSKVQNNLDPKKIPAISFIGDDVRFNDKSFGRVRFETVPNGSGMIIKELKMNSSILELHATGYWQATRNGSTTNFKGTASTKKVSDVLTAWGFNSTNFVAGVGEVKFDLGWPNAPFNPAENGLSGKLSLHLGEGRVVDVGDNGAKMGLGRMLSLFSLQTIPRRLSLDFSDLFEKGYSFDSMDADFTFKNGNAYTENMRFDGPVAAIALAGRIGLATKDFDIKLGVTPHMTASLPVVATFATGTFNPIAGALLWAFDKIVSSRSVSSVTTYQYRITGPWDKPSWNQMSGK